MKKGRSPFSSSRKLKIAEDNARRLFTATAQIEFSSRALFSQVREGTCNGEVVVADRVGNIIILVGLNVTFDAVLSIIRDERVYVVPCTEGDEVLRALFELATNSS